MSPVSGGMEQDAIRLLHTTENSMQLKVCELTSPGSACLESLHWGGRGSQISMASGPHGLYSEIQDCQGYVATLSQIFFSIVYFLKFSYLVFSDDISYK